ncbi:hypothetical protein BDR07DRAFT_1389233 [Suillus spraguei]|nr:hypothetical protein BDR07DRAFT_1389233 [Suillus spraguei]
MVNCCISDDAKHITLRLEAPRRDSDDEICQLYATGDVTKTLAIGRGRPRKLIHSDCLYLLRLARHKPTLFLDEYSHRLEEYRDLPVSLATIHASFKCVGLNIKRVQM